MSVQLCKQKANAKNPIYSLKPCAFRALPKVMCFFEMAVIYDRYH